MGIVVGHQLRRPFVPAPAQPHPDVWIRLDVLDVLRLLAELRDEPELIADSAAAQWSLAWFTRLASRRLQQRLQGISPHQRVGDPFLKEVADAVTLLAGHGIPFRPLRSVTPSHLV